jgi:hypothetical protein
VIAVIAVNRLIKGTVPDPSKVNHLIIELNLFKNTANVVSDYLNKFQQGTSTA